MGISVPSGSSLVNEEGSEPPLRWGYERSWSDEQNSTKAAIPRWEASVTPFTPPSYPHPQSPPASSHNQLFFQIGNNTEEENHQAVSNQKNKVISSTAPTINIEKEKHQMENPDQKNLISFMERRLNEISELDEEVCSSYSIFRVPRNLRELEPKAYTPQFISIGPRHRDDDYLRRMEVHKWHSLRRHLKRTRHDLKLYINAFSLLVDRARKCYAWRTDCMNDQEFIEMLLLDSCFILELLLPKNKPFWSNYGPLFAARAVFIRIPCDMLLLENQIPLFVLDRLLEITEGEYYRGDSVHHLALNFFRWTILGTFKNQKTPNRENQDEGDLHLLHVIRQSLIPLQSTRPLDEHVDYCHQPHLTMPCVSLLLDSGVKFEKRLSSNLTDIKFEGGVLKIPPLLIDDSTKSIFLNLMAFEQCHPQCSDHISTYFTFMDRLINTPRDVAYLQKKGIINHQLGSDEAVAQLFNDLCREIGTNDKYNYLSAMTCQLIAHVKRKWPTWRASLNSEYFRHPWSIISLVGALLIIGLTLMQTLYSILAYHC